MTTTCIKTRSCNTVLFRVGNNPGQVTRYLAEKIGINAQEIKNPFLFHRLFKSMFDFPSDVPVSLPKLPISLKEVYKLSEQERDFMNYIKLAASYAGLKEIPMSIVKRMQGDFVFAFLLLYKSRDLFKNLDSHLRNPNGIFADKIDKEKIKRFRELTENANAEYSLPESLNAISSPLNNFGMDYLAFYRRYCQAADKTEFVSNLRSSMKQWHSVKIRAYESFIEISILIEKIKESFAVDFDVLKLPNAFFEQGYRNFRNQDLGDPKRENYYKHQVRSLLFIAGLLINRYGHSEIQS